MSADEREVERLVQLIAERVQARMGTGPAPGAAAGAGGECGCGRRQENCEECGKCVVRKPWAVRALEDAGATRVGAPAGVAQAGQVPTDIARLIDHTLLKPEATRDEVTKLCGEARQHHFASVCVNTTWVPTAKQLLRGSGVMVCAVVGFPLGAMAPGAKAYEAREAVRLGADEIDMVINLGALKSRDYDTVFEDICRVVKAAEPSRVKVILETGALNAEEKIIGCVLSKLAGAAFVKTSTGFGKGGATVDDVALMRKIVGPDMGVKASGGIRTRDDAEKMAQAGASRIGASASVAIATATAGSDQRKGEGRRPGHGGGSGAY